MIKYRLDDIVFGIIDYFNSHDTPISKSVKEFYSVELEKLNFAFHTIKNNYEAELNKQIVSYSYDRWNNLFSYLSTTNTETNILADTIRKTCIIL